MSGTVIRKLTEYKTCNLFSGIQLNKKAICHHPESGKPSHLVLGPAIYLHFFFFVMWQKYFNGPFSKYFLNLTRHNDRDHQTLHAFICNSFFFLPCDRNTSIDNILTFYTFVGHIYPSQDLVSPKWKMFNGNNRFVLSVEPLCIQKQSCQYISLKTPYTMQLCILYFTGPCHGKTAVRFIHYTTERSCHNQYLPLHWVKCPETYNTRMWCSHGILDAHHE